jgi:CDGSH-type Zn-finger protein
MNGPYIVAGRVPLSTWEVCKDEDGDRLIWREVKKYPLKEKYALCRCGNSGNKPFCDGSHVNIQFDVTVSFPPGVVNKLSHVVASISEVNDQDGDGVFDPQI